MRIDLTPRANRSALMDGLSPVLAFLVADPPDLLVGTAPIGGVRIRYGVFVAAGGAAAMVIGGLRAREMRRGASSEAPHLGIGGAPRDMGP